MLNFIANGIDALSTAEHGSNRRSWEYFDQKLGELQRRDLESIIARGQVLIEAHDELERGSYEATVKRRFDLGTARMYRIAGRDPESVNIVELVPAIYAAVPDTSTEEIVEALRWSARKDLREANELERGRRR